MNEKYSDLRCVKCRNIFESIPITLAPCGWVVCSHHLDSNVKKCIVCNSKHDLIKQNCLTTKSIEIKYIKYKLESSQIEFSRFIQTKMSEKNMDQLIVTINQRRELAKSKIFDYFEGLESEAKIIAKQNFAKSNESFQLEFEIPSNKIDFKALFGKLSIIHVENRIEKPEIEIIHLDQNQNKNTDNLMQSIEKDFDAGRIFSASEIKQYGKLPESKSSPQSSIQIFKIPKKSNSQLDNLSTQIVEDLIESLVNLEIKEIAEEFLKSIRKKQFNNFEDLQASKRLKINETDINPTEWLNYEECNFEVFIQKIKVLNL